MIVICFFVDRENVSGLVKWVFVGDNIFSLLVLRVMELVLLRILLFWLIVLLLVFKKVISDLVVLIVCVLV